MVNLNIFNFIAVIFGTAYITLSFIHLFLYSLNKKDKINLWYFVIGMVFSIILFHRMGVIQNQRGVSLINVFSGIALCMYLYYAFELRKYKVYLMTLVFVYTILLGFFSSLYLITAIKIFYFVGLIVIAVLSTTYLLSVVVIFFRDRMYREKIKLMYFSNIITIFLAVLLTVFADLLHIPEEIFIVILYSLQLYIFVVSTIAISLKNDNNRNGLERLNESLFQKVDEQTRELADEKEQHRKYFLDWAHESKTIIFLLKSSLDLLQQKTGVKAEIIDINRQLKELQKKTQNYLQSNRTAAYYNEVALLDLSRLFCEKVSLYIEPARLKSKKLIFNSASGLYLKADARALDTVLNNLIDNAIKYTEYGLVEVELKQEKQAAIISVKDTGPGIPASEQENIFKQFYRGRGTGVDGAGVGLYLTQELVKNMAGEIWVESEPGKGALFTVKLPLYFPQKQELATLAYTEPQEPIFDATQAEETPQVLELDRDKKTLFIADDNQDIRNYFHKALSTDYNIFLFQSGNQLLAALPKLPRPDAILSDYMMDDGDGLELLKEVRKVYADIAFILITAQASEELREQFLAAGATAYLEKDFKIDELKSRISNLLALSEKSSKLKPIAKINPDVLKEEIKNRAGFFRISRREAEFLFFYFLNKKWAEIAQEMGITEVTARRHKSNISEKIGLKDRHDILKLFGYSA